MSKLIYGKGFNSKDKHKARISGTDTPAYKTWHGMIVRCYSAKYHEKHPTYIGCSVTDEWLDYQNFADWFYDNPYSNREYQLDKDLLILANKIYSPDRCVFVPQQLNSLLNDHGVARGQYPQGVCFIKLRNKFRAQIGINGKPEFLGYFDCPQEAHQAYKKAKEAYVKEKALEWQDRIGSDVFDALMQWTLDDK